MGVRAVALAIKFGQKLHSSVLCNREIFRMYSGDFGAGEFQYAIRICKGAKGVAMATKFKQK